MDAGVGVPVHIAKEKPPINVVGDVGGRIAIIVVWSTLLTVAVDKNYVNVSISICKFFQNDIVLFKFKD